MDSQTCIIKLTNWMYGTQAQNLSFADHFTKLKITDNFTTDGEWELERSWLWSSASFAERGHAYPVLGISLVLRRNPRFYLMNIVVPFVILSLLASVIFMIPPKTGEKISFGVNTMVSFSVLFLFILDIMPSSGDYTPMLGKVQSSTESTPKVAAGTTYSCQVKWSCWCHVSVKTSYGPDHLTVCLKKSSTLTAKKPSQLCITDPLPVSAQRPIKWKMYPCHGVLWCWAPGITHPC